jgi:hypothetical protein
LTFNAKNPDGPNGEDSRLYRAIFLNRNKDLPRIGSTLNLDMVTLVVELGDFEDEISTLFLDPVTVKRTESNKYAVTIKSTNRLYTLVPEDSW